QLVARAGDGLGGVEAEHAAHLELAHHGGAVERVGCTDTRDDRVHIGQLAALEEDLGSMCSHRHVALDVVDHGHAVPARLSGFDQAPRRVQLRLLAQDGDVHRAERTTAHGAEHVKIPWEVSAICRSGEAPLILDAEVDKCEADARAPWTSTPKNA